MSNYVRLQHMRKFVNVAQEVEKAEFQTDIEAVTNLDLEEESFVSVYLPFSGFVFSSKIYLPLISYTLSI